MKENYNRNIVTERMEVVKDISYRDVVRKERLGQEILF